ncbi:hypothetical protein D3C83_162240 [compost metagenome]
MALLELGLELVQQFLAARDEHEAAAAPREFTREVHAEAAGGAGDKGRAALEFAGVVAQKKNPAVV